MMRRLSLVAVFLGLLFPGAAAAIGPGEALKDGKLEARAREIGRQLRCLVCQNQSIDDSDAPLAQDLRRLVRKRLQAGDSNRAVIAYIHARYGDFVLLRPPVDLRTWLLWFGPAAVLLLVLAILFWRARRIRRVPDTGANATGLTDAEKNQADALLQESEIGHTQHHDSGAPQ